MNHWWFLPPGVLLASCAAGASSRGGTTAACPGQEVSAPAPPRPFSGRAQRPPPVLPEPEPRCIPDDPVLSRHGEGPQIVLGGAVVFATQCGGLPPATPPARRGAGTPRFPVCRTDWLINALPVSAFVRGPPRPGERVFVRGRLRPFGLHSWRVGPSIGLVGSRDQLGICIPVELETGPGSPPDFWRCTGSHSEDRAGFHCDDNPARPPIDTEIIADVVVVALAGRYPLAHTGAAELGVQSFCVVGATP